MKQKSFLLVFIALTSVVSAQLSLSPLFTDHMVLQQQTDAPIWGKAKANQQLTVYTSWDANSRTITADGQGLWKTNLATPEAGGPYEIVIKAGKKEQIKLQHVLIGEVWLCSGQSNMEWRLRDGLVNQKQEIAAADYPQIRMITVQKAIDFTPVDACKIEDGGWKVCSPETVGAFSAVAYFFGKDIHEQLNVPVGLINSSWGGTVAEAWTASDYLMQMPYFHEYVEKIRQMPTDKVALEKIYQESLKGWLHELNKKDKAFENGQLLWANLQFDDSDWYDFPVPGMAQTVGMTQKNGVFWFRKIIDIPANWSGRDITLSMGPIDDDDFTYFNGELIGKTEGWMSPRNYKIPGKLVKPGQSVLAIRVIDTGGAGGMGGDKENYWMSCSKGKIDISGDWKAKLSLDIKAVGSVPRRLDGNPNEPTVLYNAMIHPLIPFAIKGAIWYQGESNADRADQYRDLLPLMIGSWREHFGHEFPFYIVQLANFMRLQEEPVESTWAELREAQSLTAQSLGQTGIAVAIDIGEAGDIHPKNKQDVGKRLALAARAQTYGEQIPYSGPVYKSHKIEGNTIRLSFDHTDGGLNTPNGAKLQGFTMAGTDHQFYWADAVIAGDEIIVSCPEVKFPVAVRYAWADNPICNLYNGAGLPASPFRTDSWRGITE